MKERIYSGTRNSKISERELRNRVLARRAAAEGVWGEAAPRNTITLPGHGLKEIEQQRNTVALPEHGLIGEHPDKKAAALLGNVPVLKITAEHIKTREMVHTANSYDLCTKTARDEWGFAGIIMTDWTTTNDGGGSSAAKCLEAGNDLIMPGRETDIHEILDAVRGAGKQYLDERYLRKCAANMLRMIKVKTL